MRCRKDKPFFLQLCFSDPHRPLDRNAIPEPHDPAKLKLPAWYPDTPGVRDDFARYYDEIARFDGDFGTVLAELEKRGLTQSTLVAMMGDNGASQFRGKGTLYETGIHVPLLVRWPGVSKAGASTGELISGEDLAPTFLEAAGVAAAQGDDGAAASASSCAASRLRAASTCSPSAGPTAAACPNNSAAFDLGRCVVGQRYKLIYNALWQLPYTPVDFAGDPFWKELQQMNAEGKLSPELSRLYFSPTRPMFELYDLQNDPNEFKNLIRTPEGAAMERQLREVLQEWMILERDYLPLPIADQAAAKKAAAKKATAKKAGRRG